MCVVKNGYHYKGSRDKHTGHVTSMQS